MAREIGSRQSVAQAAQWIAWWSPLQLCLRTDHSPLFRPPHPSHQNNYPETLGKTVIINAPTGGRGLALQKGLAAGGPTQPA